MPPLSQLQGLDVEHLNLEVQEDIVQLAEEPQANGSLRSSPEVTLPGLGTAKGKVMKTYEGRDMYAFQSMPFAIPPVGQRRFKSSELWDNSSRTWPTEEDEDFYDATYLRARCAQSSLILTQIAGREDCLHISVYTPQNPSSAIEKLPVMYWIYGGGYLSGDAFLYVPTKLIDHDVVVVVIQYRLGVLGFLASRTPENPGNMGLSDQVTGLRWVQKHISYFGGDPDKVTVFGQSAGGASSSWMQLTPLTQGPANAGRQLLHRVIPQSGSALEHWTLDMDPDTSFQDTAALTGCTQSTVTEQLNCMRELPFENITQAGLILYATDRRAGGLGFRGVCPVIQTPLLEQTDVEVLIPKNPIQILEDGEYLKIPTMGGAVRDEGSLVAGLMWDDFIVPNNYTNDTKFLRDETIPMLLNAFGYEDTTNGLASTVQMAYMPQDVEMGNWTSMVGGIIDMTGVMFLKSGIWQVAHKINLEDESVPFYFYSFEFESDDSLFDWIFSTHPDTPVPGGVAHADELIYLFHLPGDFDDRQLLTSHRLTTLWTNFAKYGNPTPDSEDNWKELGVDEWKPFNVNELNFMLMSDEFTLDHDFVTRWNHHRPSGSPIDSTTTAATSQNPDSVSREEYDEVLKEMHGLQTGTIFVGVLLGVSILIVVLLAVKLRRVSTV